MDGTLIGFDFFVEGLGRPCSIALGSSQFSFSYLTLS